MTVSTTTESSIAVSGVPLGWDGDVITGLPFPHIGIWC